MSLSCLYNIVKRVTQQPRVYLGELECNVALRCPGSVWTASSPPSCCLGPLLHHVQHQGLRLQHHGLPPESGESIPLPPVSSDHRLAQWSAASEPSDKSRVETNIQTQISSPQCRSSHAHNTDTNRDPETPVRSGTKLFVFHLFIYIFLPVQIYISNLSPSFP